VNRKQYFQRLAVFLTVLREQCEMTFDAILTKMLPVFQLSLCPASDMGRKTHPASGIPLSVTVGKIIFRSAADPAFMDEVLVEDYTGRQFRMKNGNQHPVIFRSHDIILKLKQDPDIASDTSDFRGTDERQRNGIRR